MAMRGESRAARAARPVAAITDRVRARAIILAQNPPPSACATYTGADAELACSFAGATTPCCPPIERGPHAILALTGIKAWSRRAFFPLEAIVVATHQGPEAGPSPASAQVPRPMARLWPQLGEGSVRRQAR